MRHLPHNQRTGLSRLGRYTVGRRKRLTGVMLLAAISAAAPVAGWAIVGDAIDNGIKADDLTRLTADVLLYVLVGLAAWILGTTTWLMLAGIGQQMVLDLRRDLFEHLTSLSLRYFSQQKAGWIIARLTSDVDALSDVLNQGLTTLVVNSMTLVAAINVPISSDPESIIFAPAKSTPTVAIAPRNSIAGKKKDESFCA